MDRIELGLPASRVEFAIQVERARHRIVTIVDEALSDLEASFAGTRVLRLMADTSGPLHAGEIGRKLGTTRQAAHRLLQRHQAHGYVTIADDGWARSARITPDGVAHAYECVVEIERVLEKLGRYPDVELIELGEQLQQIADTLAGRDEPMWVPDL